MMNAVKIRNYKDMNKNIAKLTWLNLTYHTFSNHLALPGAPVVSLDNAQ